MHLSDFPVVHEAAFDPGLDDAHGGRATVVELGRRVRVETKVRTRQPLAEAVAHIPRTRAPRWSPAADHRRGAQRARRFGLPTSADAFGTWRAKPDFKVLGPRLGPRVKALAAALAADDGTLAERLAAGERDRGRDRRRTGGLDRAR